MKIDTRFGEQDIDPETVITFTGGLPGFDQLTQFKLFHEEGRAGLFWLQSVEDAGIRLPVTDPTLLDVNYEFTLSDDELAQLGTHNSDDLRLLVTLAPREGDAGSVHANFLNPIVVNTQSRQALQKSLRSARGAITIRAD